jgi:glutamine amidotransferase
MKTVIVDYGLGNLFSIQRAVNFVGGDSLITERHKEILSAERIILPGVGAFGDAIAKLKERKLDLVLQECAKAGKPVLGICLGMQLLMSTSEEFGLHEGLNLVPGRVVKFPANKRDAQQYKIPHIGWNQIEPPRGLTVEITWSKTILENNRYEDFVYFNHSYFVEPANPFHVIAVTEYGNRKFCSVIKSGTIYGLQFHPELSGEAGLKIFKDFISDGKYSDEEKKFADTRLS